MTGQQDDGRGDDDVLEQGQGRWSAPSWWPSWRPPKISRPAAVVILAALILGLGLGYLAGSRHPAGGGTTPAAAARGRVSAEPASLGGPTLEQTSNECSAQHGTTLQLGVEVSNLSAAPLTLGQVKAFTPLGGLHVTAVRWGSCGELPALPQDPLNDATDRYLPPGASGWLTVTATVLVHCPGPYPVQFSVGYRQRGRYRQIVLPGFPDLSGVAWSGCRN